MNKYISANYLDYLINKKEPVTPVSQSVKISPKITSEKPPAQHERYPTIGIKNEVARGIISKANNMIKGTIT